MPSRDAALAALHDRLAIAQASPGLLLSNDALRDAADLAATTDATTDPSAAQALGWFHWNRYLSLPDGDGHSDRAAAIRYFASVHQTSPASVPAPIQQEIRDREHDSARPDVDAVVANSQAARLFSDYQSNGKLPALIEAIALVREAVAAIPDGHPDRPMYLSNLAGTLRVLFGRTGDMEALGEAVQAGRGAVAATADGHPDRAARLGNLGIALRVLFGRTGDMEALGEAVQAGRSAVAATADGHPGRPLYLSNLAGTLQVLFGRTGDMEALGEAVQTGRGAVAATPDGHPGRAMYVSNLGVALQALFERTGDMEALGEAVQAKREAVAATPDGDPDRAARLSNLGIVLRLLFERTKDMEALGEAVQAGRSAVAATADGHPDRAARLSNLAGTLRVLSERTGDMEALGEAIQAERGAVAATPDGHPDRAARLGNLGIALQALFGRTGDMETLTEAVQAGRSAVAAIPDGHPGRAIYLSNLGIALQALFERTGDMETLTEAVSCFRAAGGSLTAAAPARIRGWRRAAGVLAGGVGEGAQDALAAAEAAVRLLPQVTPRWLARADREHQLGEAGSLAGVAAAAAIAAGRPERAVELLEQTRGVLVADTVDARSSDLTRLRAAVPELAQEFGELRARSDALDQTAAIPRGGLAGPDTSQDLEQARRDARDLGDARRETQAAWDQLITRIRGVDGFADFLAAPSIRKLAAEAHDGPVVFVSASPARCDALILTHDPHTPVRLVPLTALTEAAAAGQAARLLDARRNATDPLRDAASRRTAQAEVLEVLAWIWDTITEPVLTALGHTTTPSPEESWPRVWWSPVGVLVYLPMHAAGHHSDLTASAPVLAANPRTTLDRVISSYTTTVRSLAYARTHHPGAGNGKAVVVAVPDAPGTPPLPGVTAETTTLTRLLPDVLVLANPTRDTVLAALPTHQVAHFACHGYADWNDPASSGLILRDHHTAPLTVADVSALHLTGGLAYLSACDTTVNSPRLADEAVHLAGAFHLAGYQHVIGTLWPINDALARAIAEDFYIGITAGGTTVPQTSLSARALHDAIRRLRARYPQAPTLWAAHTHTGA